MKINSDIVLVAEIKNALRKNKQFFGKPYCPCIPFTMYSDKNAKDYICPCKDFRENKEKREKCRCGLFIKE